MIAGFDPARGPGFSKRTSTPSWTEQLGTPCRAGRPSPWCAGAATPSSRPPCSGCRRIAWASRLLDEVHPRVWPRRILPGVPYVPSAPTGGDLPFDPAVGVATYFGVGGLPAAGSSDVRSAGRPVRRRVPGLRHPPRAVRRWSGRSGPAPPWPGTIRCGRPAVPRDSGASWDFEDVRDEYVRTVFGVDPFAVRYADPDRALDYGRAVVVQLDATVMTEWRCRRSACAGGLVLNWQDQGAGAGMGVARRRRARPRRRGSHWAGCWHRWRCS